MRPSQITISLLTLANALGMTTNTVLITIAALVGYDLATDKALATLPLALRQGATMATTIPASMLMAKIGRRGGFIVGAAIGAMGASLGIYSVLIQQFWLFAAAAVVLGVSNGFTGYYRFAAADAAEASGKAQAISWVVAGGVIAAILGPWLATRSESWFPTTLYVGALVAILGLQLLTMVVLLGVKIRKPQDQLQQSSGRPLRDIMRQPIFMVAVLGSMVGYGFMTLVMTATPLAMADASHSFDQTATVIQWHVLGMFAPSFFTGYLIQRFGVIKIILTGAGFNLLCLGCNLQGQTFPHFWLALFLLGVGWNFMFVGSTTLLTEAYRPVEKAKTQATHDFLMFGFVTLTTFLSGQLFHSFNWAVVNQVGGPAIVVTVLAVIWLRQHRVGSALESS